MTAIRSPDQVLAECMSASAEILRQHEAKMWAEARRLAVTVPRGQEYTSCPLQARARLLEMEWDLSDPYFRPALAWMVEQIHLGMDPTQRLEA
uniref:Uncharacterized protein n=1 Tax=viral metagenome TaxID=1070528 RepID=A0A6M3J2I8_9ZZZZ